MRCWKCGKELEGLEKPHFRTVCDFCTAWQHACVNCRHYQPGLPNDCKVPGTDPVSDREASNFCDEFAIRQESGKGRDSGKEKNNFEDLFKD